MLIKENINEVKFIFSKSDSDILLQFVNAKITEVKAFARVEAMARENKS